jgi:hypothetical protein
MFKSKVRDLLEKATFIYAKTLPLFKHFYTKRESWEDSDFVEVVKYIRKYGVKEKFFNKEYIYYYLGDYKYWTMGNPLDETILINKAYDKTDRQKRHKTIRAFSNKGKSSLLQ